MFVPEIGGSTGSWSDDELDDIVIEDALSDTRSDFRSSEPVGDDGRLSLSDTDTE